MLTRLALALVPLLLASVSAQADTPRAAGLIFAHLDADGSGDVTMDEIAAARTTQFQRADADGDGQVTEAELAALQERLARFARQASDGLASRFQRLDSDGDAALSLAEYTAPSPFLTLIDADGNGAISRAEFDRALAVFSQSN
jgi:EF hand